MFELLFQDNVSAVRKGSSHRNAVPLPTPTRPVLVLVHSLSADNRLNSPNRALSDSELMNLQLKRKNNGHLGKT